MILPLLLQISLCEGFISDKDHHPQPTQLAKPPQGIPFTDPTFGSNITRITSVDPAEGANAVIKPLYSTIQAWNADESLLLLWHRGKGYEIYEGQPPYKFIAPLPIAPLNPSKFEEVWWDETDPNVLRFTNNYLQLPWLVRLDLTSGFFLEHDFSDLCPAELGQLTMGGDPGMPGRGPLKLIGLRCGVRVILYSLEQEAVLHTFHDWLWDPNYRFSRTLMTPPSDQFFLYDRYVFAAFPPMHQTTLSMLKFFEHASLGSGTDGIDRWNTVDFDGPSPASLISWRLDTGASKVVVGQENGWPYPPTGTHISSISVGAPDWAALGIVGDGLGILPLHGEVILANIQSGEICRIAHHRSKAGEGPWRYWGETHLVHSPLGTRILFASDWGGGPSVDTYVIDLRRPETIASPPPSYDMNGGGAQDTSTAVTIRLP